MFQSCFDRRRRRRLRRRRRRLILAGLLLPLPLFIFFHHGDSLIHVGPASDFSYLTLTFQIPRSRAKRGACFDR